ncbi:MAG: hypothetical protein IJ599_01050 [Alphaproteobacteria bacterium]|nr:hypothetical protein [Alphaproteobacteria bacterium]
MELVCVNSDVNEKAEVTNSSAAAARDKSFITWFVERVLEKKFMGFS